MDFCDYSYNNIYLYFSMKINLAITGCMGRMGQQIIKKYTKKIPWYQNKFIFEGRFLITIIYLTKVIHAAYREQLA